MFDPLGLSEEDAGDVDVEQREPLPKRQTQEESRRPHPQTQAGKPFESAKDAVEASSHELADLTSADYNRSEWGTKFYNRKKTTPDGKPELDENGDSVYEYTYAPPVRGVDQNGDPYDVDVTRSKIEGSGWKETEAFNHSHPHDDWFSETGRSRFSPKDINWAHRRARSEKKDVTLFVITSERRLQQFTSHHEAKIKYKSYPSPQAQRLHETAERFIGGTFRDHKIIE